MNLLNVCEDDAPASGDQHDQTELHSFSEKKKKKVIKIRTGLTCEQGRGTGREELTLIDDIGD